MKTKNELLEYAKKNKLVLYWCTKYEEYYFSNKVIKEDDLVLFSNAKLIHDFTNK